MRSGLRFKNPTDPETNINSLQPVPEKDQYQFVNCIKHTFRLERAPVSRRTPPEEDPAGTAPSPDPVTVPNSAEAALATAPAPADRAAPPAATRPPAFAVAAAPTAAPAL